MARPHPLLSLAIRTFDAYEISRLFIELPNCRSKVFVAFPLVALLAALPVTVIANRGTVFGQPLGSRKHPPRFPLLAYGASPGNAIIALSLFVVFQPFFLREDPKIPGSRACCALPFPSALVADLGPAAVLPQIIRKTSLVFLLVASTALSTFGSTDLAFPSV